DLHVDPVYERPDCDIGALEQQIALDALRMFENSDNNPFNADGVTTKNPVDRLSIAAAAVFDSLKKPAGTPANDAYNARLEEIKRTLRLEIRPVPKMLGDKLALEGGKQIFEDKLVMVWGSKADPKILMNIDFINHYVTKHNDYQPETVDDFLSIASPFAMTFKDFDPNAVKFEIGRPYTTQADKLLKTTTLDAFWQMAATLKSGDQTKRTIFGPRLEEMKREMQKMYDTIMGIIDLGGGYQIVLNATASQDGNAVKTNNPLSKRRAQIIEHILKLMAKEKGIDLSGKLHVLSTGENLHCLPSSYDDQGNYKYTASDGDYKEGSAEYSKDSTEAIKDRGLQLVIVRPDVALPTNEQEMGEFYQDPYNHGYVSIFNVEDGFVDFDTIIRSASITGDEVIVNGEHTISTNAANGNIPNSTIIRGQLVWHTAQSNGTTTASAPITLEDDYGNLADHGHHLGHADDKDPAGTSTQGFTYVNEAEVKAAEAALEQVRDIVTAMEQVEFKVPEQRTAIVLHWTDVKDLAQKNNTVYPPCYVVLNVLDKDTASLREITGKLNSLKDDEANLKAYLTKHPKGHKHDIAQTTLERIQTLISKYKERYDAFTSAVAYGRQALAGTDEPVPALSSFEEAQAALEEDIYKPDTEVDLNLDSKDSWATIKLAIELSIPTEENQTTAESYDPASDLNFEATRDKYIDINNTLLSAYAFVRDPSTKGAAAKKEALLTQIRTAQRIYEAALERCKAFEADRTVTVTLDTDYQGRNYANIQMFQFNLRGINSNDVKKPITIKAKLADGTILPDIKTEYFLVEPSTDHSYHILSILENPLASGTHTYYGATITFVIELQGGVKKEVAITLADTGDL
ncbi:hypothetical protein K1X76_10295, partial [bacterium]|nr:hypothetical protein [bacterium]